MRLVLSLRRPLERFELAIEIDSDVTVLGLFGPSGAGKTSVLEAVAGLRRGWGQVSFGSEIWEDDRLFVAPEGRGVGLVPQDSLLFPHLDVASNISFGAGRSGSAGDTEKILAILGLEGFAGRAVATLSGGEQRRVALGRALASSPRLLLLDEPLSGLDLPLKRRLLAHLARIREEIGVPTLLVSHDPVEVQALCDELVVLRRGRVVATGPTRQVFLDPVVFPSVSDQQFENVLPCRGTDGTSVHLGDPSAPVELVTGATTRSARWVGLAARDLILAREPVRGLSARNVLPARLVDLVPADGSVLGIVSLGSGIAPLAVELTSEAAAELAPGQAVHVVVKATACRVY